MKALEILKILNKYYTGKFAIKINEAIKELEDLQNKNKSLVKTLEKYNEEMIELRKVNQDLLNTIIEAQESIKNILEGIKWDVQKMMKVLKKNYIR